MAEIDLGKVVGPQGEPGAKGETGKEGPQGPPGPEGVVDGNSTISFVTPEAYQEPQSGDSIANLFGRFKRWILDIVEKIGDLTSLKTPDKKSAVAAINANYDSIAQLEQDIGNPADLTTISKEVVGAVNELNADIDNATKVISKCDLICTIEKLTNNVVKEFQANWQDYYFISICYGNYGNIFNSILIPSYYLETTTESTRIVVNSNADNACSIYKKNASTLYARTGNWVDSNGRIRVYGIMKK